MIIADRQEILEEFDSLTLSQRKLIVAVASGENEKLTSQQFLSSIGLSSSTVNDSLNALELKDYLQKSPTPLNTLKFVQLFLFVLVLTASIFSRQFGGNRSLPVA